ncbi:MAG: cellulose biosynthesis cyclic di-GMP-binding regulatory protein BcsB [Limnobacter sp.]|uniref:cellulose biosynthesis cyclic di-GMP-binding regulatory protein BcsB n=1 Tax=Limnobacter sp. TaxID=2003368 RepID=UPI00391D9335
MPMRILNLSALCALMLLTAPGAVYAAPSAKTEPTAPAASASLGQTRVLTLAQMGQPSGLKLNGVNRSVELNAGVRLDEAVRAAHLELKVMYPQGMRHDQSFIRVYVNNQLSAMAQLSAAKAGVLNSVRLVMDPTLFTDFSVIRIEYDGTYDTECRDPQNPTLRLDVRPDSTLTLQVDPQPLVNDLALLPAPFFDRRDNRKLQLPVVLPKQLSPNTLKAAGVLASWMGAQAFYRQAEFQPVANPSDDQHTVILALADQLPAGTKTPNITGPMLWMDSSPTKPWVKRLYIVGRTEEELLTAVNGLVIEGQVLSGQQASIKEVNLGAPRKPYDAPRYVPTHRPVRFAELMDYSTQLEATADRPRVRLNLRLPPDLFSWAGKNIPMALKYRYTAPSRWNDSLLNVEINNALIQSFRLSPRQDEAQSRLNIDLLGAAELSSESAFQVPAFRVGGSNELTFGFGFQPEGHTACTQTNEVARGSVDPESTLDFSTLPHYTRMPNLTAFANGGYPYSIFADLSDTAMILPKDPSGAEVQAYLNMMGLFGQWTGLPASRVTVALGPEDAQGAGKHWVALGATDRLPWLDSAKMSLPMVLDQAQRSLGLGRAVSWFQALWSGADEAPPATQARALIQGTGPLGAILGFESPWTREKSALVVTGTDEASFARAMAALSSYDDIPQIRGSVTLLRGEEVQSFQTGSTWVSGYLPWRLRIRIAFSEHPILIALGGALGGVLLALLAYGWLARRAGRRGRAH